MSKKKNPNPYNLLMPDTEENKKMFENLMKIQCTQEEIAGVFEVSVDTLKRWIKRNYDGNNFAYLYKIYGASGRASLRRYQMKQAEKVPIMAIWLGKQYLGQKDVIEQHNINHEGDDPLTKAIKGSIGEINTDGNEDDED